MYIKNALISLFLVISSSIFAQVQIDDVGDGWMLKVDSALQLIKKVDQNNYNDVIKHCNHVSYWMGGFSTTQDTSMILISTKDIKISSINNIACILVHESKHLEIMKKGLKYTNKEEEYICYKHEYEFVQKIPNAESWLIIHIIKNIIKNKPTN